MTAASPSQAVTANSCLSVPRLLNVNIIYVVNTDPGHRASCGAIVPLTSTNKILLFTFCQFIKSNIFLRAVTDLADLFSELIIFCLIFLRGIFRFKDDLNVCKHNADAKTELRTFVVHYLRKSNYRS